MKSKKGIITLKDCIIEDIRIDVKLSNKTKESMDEFNAQSPFDFEV